MKTIILTRKQHEVMGLIMRGWRCRAIAKSLGVTENGVKYHKTNIFKAYGVTSTKALIKKHKERNAA